MLKKSFLTVLLVAVCVFAAVGMAQAVQVDGMRSGLGTAPLLPATLNVHVNPAGLGDALIYGYYNARGAVNLIRVVNTSVTTGYGAKVRFREGKNSNEVLDFFICLSAGDQWTAVLSGDTNTANPATLTWYDNDTPTYPDPNIPMDDLATNNAGASVQLRYAGIGAASSVTQDDTKEGYFEIIANQSWPDSPGGGKTVRTPNDCGFVVLDTTDPFYPTLGSTDNASGSVTAVNRAAWLLLDSSNDLMGTSLIVNTAASSVAAYAYNATALADFRNVNLAGLLSVDSVPTLSNASPGTIAAVNYVLTKAAEYATYELEASAAGTATIINTFPTKRRTLVDSGSAASGSGPGALLIGGSVNGPFNDGAYIDGTGVILPTTTLGRCETLGVRIWDDKENTPGSSAGFSPSNPQPKQKCNEVNLALVGTASHEPLNTALEAFQIDATSYTIGWVQEIFSTGGTFAATSRATQVDGRTTWGLPVISYELQRFTYGGANLSNMLPLRYTTIIN